MNWLDAIIIVFLGLCTFIGSRWRALKAFFLLTAVVFAVFMAGQIYASATNYSGAWMGSENQAQLVSFVFIFIIVIVLTIIAFYLLAKLLNALFEDSSGLTAILVPFIGIIIGIGLAGYFSGSLADWLSHWLHSRSQAAVISFLVIFIPSTIFAISMLRSFTSLAEEDSHESLFNQLNIAIGTILGLAIGGVLSGTLLTLMAAFYYSSTEATLQNSIMASFLLNNFPFMLHILPREFDMVRQLFS